MSANTGGLRYGQVLIGCASFKYRHFITFLKVFAFQIFTDNHIKKTEEMQENSASSLNIQESMHHRMEDLAHQLQEVLDQLRANADCLAGGLIHNDAMFQATDSNSLDDKPSAIIAELRFLSLGFTE